MRTGSEVATPQSIDAAVNAIIEKMKYFFFPKRSPSHAVSGRMITFAIA